MSPSPGNIGQKGVIVHGAEEIAITSTDLGGGKRGLDTTATVVSGPGSALTASTPNNATVTTSSTAIVSANTSRRGLVITHTGNVTGTLFIGIGTTALLNKGITIFPGGVWVMDAYTFSTGAINGISSSGSIVVSVQEYT